MDDILDDYLKVLYTDNRSQAEEWRGTNIPYGDDSDRPNLIRKCMTLEGKKMKINCLRKLRDQAAMNPFYQHRLDRFVDAITQTYEPTNMPGTIPGSEFKTSRVGEDMKQSLTEDVDKAVGVAVLSAMIAEVLYGAHKAYKYYLSKAARNCKGEKISKGQKIECITKYKLLGKQAEISEIKKNMSKCSKHKHPDMCKVKLNNRIKSIEKQMQKIKGRL